MTTPHSSTTPLVVIGGPIHPSIRPHLTTTSFSLPQSVPVPWNHVNQTKPICYVPLGHPVMIVNNNHTQSSESTNIYIFKKLKNAAQFTSFERGGQVGEGPERLMSEVEDVGRKKKKKER